MNVSQYKQMVSSGDLTISNTATYQIGTKLMSGKEFEEYLDQEVMVINQEDGDGEHTDTKTETTDRTQKRRSRTRKVSESKDTTEQAASEV